jgi:hypothetical protein
MQSASLLFYLFVSPYHHSTTYVPPNAHSTHHSATYVPPMPRHLSPQRRRKRLTAQHHSATYVPRLYSYSAT